MHAIPKYMNLWKSYRHEYSNLLRLGFPVLITQLGIIIVSFADTMMVGAYGVDELASAAFVNSVFMIPVVMQMGFGQGLTPLAGALYGRGDKAGVGRLLRAGTQMNVLVSLCFTLLMGMLFFGVHRMGQPSELLPLIRPYFIIILCSLLPMSVFNSFQQVCNGLNDTATPMWIILGGNVVNIIGNWLLIYGHLGCPELGLVGAGLSTLASRWLCAGVIVAVVMLRKAYAPYRAGVFCSDGAGALRRKVWITSYPVMIQSGFECMLWSFGAIVCGWFGKIQLAAYQVVNTIAQLGFMTYISFGTATSIRVANYTGVGDLTGIRRITMAGLHIILLLATIASLLFIVGGSSLIRLFTPDPAVLASAMGLLTPLVVYQYMDAIQLTFCNAIRGTSRVKPLLWISVIGYVVVGIPVLLLFSKGTGWGNVGVYYSFNVALAVASVMAILIFRHTVGRLEKELRQ